MPNSVIMNLSKARTTKYFFPHNLTKNLQVLDWCLRLRCKTSLHVLVCVKKTVPEAYFSHREKKKKKPLIAHCL